MPVLDQINRLQDRTLDVLADGNENIAEWTKSANESATKMTKKLQKRVNKTTPSIPGPREMVDSYFDFAARSMELNRNFVSSVVDAWVPKAKAAPVRKPAARKPAARKTTARKTTAKK